MGKIGWGHALKAGVDGFRDGYRREEERNERAADRAQQLEDRKEKQEARAAEKQLRVSLADAARPATVEEGAGGMLRPETMDNRDVGQPGEPGAEAGGLSLNAFRTGGKTYATAPEAQAAATSFNQPDAVRTRQAAAYDAAGKPAEAMSLQNAATAQRAAQAKEADVMWRQKIGRAMQGGHDGLAQLGSDSEFGPMAGKKVKAVPSADGKSVTYNIIGADGGLTPTPLTFLNSQEGVVQAAYLLDRSITPEHRMEGLRKDREGERKVQADNNRFDNQQALLETKMKQLELTGQIAEAKALASAARATAGGGALAKEERLRFNSRFEEAGRRMGEAQKALSSLQKNALYSTAEPNSPQAREMDDLRASIKEYKGDRDLYGSLLAGSQTGDKEKKPALADGKPAGGSAAPAKPASKAEYDKLPKGARYVHPDGTTRVKG